MESLTQSIGHTLLVGMAEHQQGITDKQYWADKLLDWTTRDPAFKTQLFRFIDVFPVLTDAEQIEQHLREYLLAPGVQLPPGLGLGFKAGSFLPGVMRKTMTAQIQQMAGNFIAGTDAQQALAVLRRRWDQGIAFSLDVLGEACLSQIEADMYQQRYLDLIQTLPQLAATWPENPKLTTNHCGNVPRVNVSIKVSSLDPVFDAIETEIALQRLIARLDPLLSAAIERGVLINFDMEQFAVKDLTLRLFKKAARQYPFEAGIVVQAYLRSSMADARELVQWTRDTGRQITVRLVKGAYWDYEIAHAQVMGYPIPVYRDKQQTDANYEQIARLLLDATPRHKDEGGIHLAVGSHNVRSIAAALAYARSIGLPENAVELQMLRGMADPLKLAASNMGYRVREYMPVGELIPGMAYLVRRLLENTSNQSWLLAEHRGGADQAHLLKAPVIDEQRMGMETIQGVVEPSHQPLSATHPQLADGKAFANEPLRDFADARQRETFAAMIRTAKVPAVSNDTPLQHVDQVIARSCKAFTVWRSISVLDRARLLLRTASLMRDRRDELAGIIIREAGKPWRSADADVCEAIDFLEYYARVATELFEPRRLGHFIAEYNEQRLRPRGPAAIIAPWNFPLAILTGMTCASLVTGNTAIVKPAEQTPGIASVMVEIMHQAGIAKDVVQLLPGKGHIIGAALASDARIAIIAFTGSRDVGLSLLKTAANRPENQPFVKRLICEMGGKNAIIVDHSADLDLAVTAVRDSAFGYSGQKCSACSRVIVMDKLHDTFVQRLIEATRALRIGDPLEPSTDIGPVIDQDAADKIHHYIKLGQQEGTLAYAGELPVGLIDMQGKPFVTPHIFTDILPGHRVACEEIFGPVLCVIKAADITQAIDFANRSQYKLTGGIISRTPSHIARVRDQFEVGNLYINRNITGALVARQPFGGLGLSGIGEKSGANHYLRQFVDTTIITENLLRRGFSPEGLD